MDYTSTYFSKGIYDVHTTVDDTMTKLARYMFFIEIALYYGIPQEQAFENLQPRMGETFDPIQVYLTDTSGTDYDLKKDKTPMYHVLIDTRCPRFTKSLEDIKESYWYVDCYQCQDVDSNKAIIRLNVSIKKRIKLLMKSKYSEMYKADELQKVFNMKESLIKRYSHIDVNGDLQLSDSIHVLLKSKNMYEKLIEVYGIKDEKTKNIMKNNEFDSKFILEKEIIDGNNINNTEE